MHLDFQRISLKNEIDVKVPVNIKGEAVGVKKGGGSLDRVLWELDGVCLPTKIPEKINVDVSELEIGDAVHIKELVLPEGLKLKHDDDAVVVSVVPPAREVEAEGDSQAEPEVIGEKKEESSEKKEKPEESS